MRLIAPVTPLITRSPSGCPVMAENTNSPKRHFRDLCDMARPVRNRAFTEPVASICFLSNSCRVDSASLAYTALHEDRTDCHICNDLFHRTCRGAISQANEESGRAAGMESGNCNQKGRLNPFQGSQP